METLKIYRPIRSSRITQRFGENKACVKPSGQIVSMIGNSCPSGSKPFYPSVGMKGHNGIDIAAIHGERVVHGATFKGKMKVEKDLDGGIGVDVISLDPILVTGKGQFYVKIRYWHLKNAIGWDGKIVEFGQDIGLADNTGASSGDHLHWAPKLCTKDGVTLYNDNGYTGAFDPTPYYDHSLFAKDVAESLGLKSALSPQEMKEIQSQLSILQKLFLQLREAAHKI